MTQRPNGNGSWNGSAEMLRCFLPRGGSVQDGCSLHEVRIVGAHAGGPGSSGWRSSALITEQALKRQAPVRLPNSTAHPRQRTRDASRARRIPHGRAGLAGRLVCRAPSTRAKPTWYPPIHLTPQRAPKAAFFRFPLSGPAPRAAYMCRQSVFSPRCPTPWPFRLRREPACRRSHSWRRAASPAGAGRTA